jgi:hypothetical protein
MKKSKPLEKTLERRAANDCTKRGWKLLKLVLFVGGGFPDRTLLFSDGSAPVFIEFKREGEKPQPLQDVWLVELRHRGYGAYVIDSLDSWQSLLQKLDNETSL